MNREIKFRAWCGERLRPVNTIGFCDDAFVETPKGSGPIEDYKLMQYIGLKDINGVEIYEGDIVKTDFGVGLVKFGVLQTCTAYGYYVKYSQYEESLHTGKHLEVIGNIYENPKLYESNS